MSQHRCEQCGAENAADAQFCQKCDFFLGWDRRDPTVAVPTPTNVEREPYTVKFRPPQTTSPNAPPPVPAPSRPSRPVTPPAVAVDQPDVELDPAVGAAVDIRIHNTSSIVDGYTVTAPRAPDWLQIQHPEIRLLNGEEKTVTVSMSIRPGFDVYIQRFRLPLMVCSVEDGTIRADTELVVTIPRVGGPVTVTAEPQMVRLRDQTSGRFQVNLDNSGSNYPQRYQLAGTDPEAAVRFRFQPQTVEVPPRHTLSVDVLFETPPLDYGRQVPRTLKVTAIGDQARIETLVNVIQERSQAPADCPVQLRLERTVTRIRDTTSAEITVIVDNRRGSRDRRLVFSGRDPEALVRFSFSQPNLYVRAGEQARIQVSVQAPLPPAGEEVQRPICVLCNDGSDDSEATGALVQSSSASPMTTAQLRLEPEHVVVRNRRHGRMRVTVDNSRGALDLNAWLSGTDPEGKLRFAFKPPRLNIPAGGVGVAALRVCGALPDAGKTIDRDITIRAGDGTGSVEARGKFTQSMSEILPMIRLAATLIGGLLVILGAIRPWFLGGPSYDIGYLTRLQSLVHNTALPQRDIWMSISQPSIRAIILALAGIMLLGILSASGKYTIAAGALAGAVVVLYIVFATNKLTSHGPAYGVVVVVVGAVLGILGGFCARPGGTS